MNTCKKTYWVYCISVIMVLCCACRHNHTNDPEWKQHDRPLWTVADTTDLESTMTVTGVLPTSLATQADTADLVAAFCNDVCWGTTAIQWVGKQPYFFLFINRPHSVNSEQQVDLTLRYYSTRTRYIYVAPSAFTFSIDAQLGTIASPVVPSFTIE